VLTEFDIAFNVLTISCYNARNNDVLLEEFRAWQRRGPLRPFKQGIRCASHVINLVVQDILCELGPENNIEEVEGIDGSVIDVEKPRAKKRIKLSQQRSSGVSTTFCGKYGQRSEN
jgi:hypothetical protein